MQTVEVYSAYDDIEANIIKALLESSGIPAEITGQALRAFAGELPFGRATAPRVRVALPDKIRAREIIDEYEQTNRRRFAGEDRPLGWTCSKCNEEVDGHFEICWNCQAPRSNH